MALIATIAMMGATAFVASGATGAFFVDAYEGEISGTVGSIAVTPSTGGSTGATNLSFDLLLPGDPQTERLSYQNTGLSPEDIWIVFNSADLLLLNGAGANVEVGIASTGGYSFYSADLGTTAVPGQFRVHNNLAAGPSGVGDSGYTNLTFEIASSVTDQAGAASALAGRVLHYQIVATQVGHAPGA